MPSLPRALEAQPDEPEILYETALAAEKLGYVELLERHLRRLIALKPDSAQAYNALGYSFADRNMRLDEAAQLIDKALSLAPDDAFILDSKGWLLFRQGKSAGGAGDLQRAFAKSPMPKSPPISAKCCGRSAGPTRPLAVWREASQGASGQRVLAATIKRFAALSRPCVAWLACLAALSFAGRPVPKFPKPTAGPSSARPCSASPPKAGFRCARASAATICVSAGSTPGKRCRAAHVAAGAGPGGVDARCQAGARLVQPNQAAGHRAGSLAQLAQRTFNARRCRWTPWPNGCAVRRPT
jgi:hypothetical protein